MKYGTNVGRSSVEKQRCSGQHCENNSGGSVTHRVLLTCAGAGLCVQVCLGTQGVVKLMHVLRVGASGLTPVKPLRTPLPCRQCWSGAISTRSDYGNGPRPGFSGAAVWAGQEVRDSWEKLLQVV